MMTPRRNLLLALLLLSTGAARPATAQAWLEKFLDERDNPPTAQPTAAPPEATSLSDVPAQPAATPAVRRALPVQPARPAPAAEIEEEAEPVPAFDPQVPVRRAQPVATPAAVTVPETPTHEPLDSVAPFAEPTPTPRRTPQEALDTPVETLPAELGRKVEEPAAPAETPAEDRAQSDALEKLDPRAHEIRLSPGAASAPADVIQFSYANSLYARKDYDRATTEFERYLHLYNNGRDRQAALYRLAESYRHRSSYNSAKKNYEALIYQYKMGDFVGPASYRLAEIYYREKDFGGAVTFFRKAALWLKDPPLVLSSKYHLARSLEGLMLTSEAIRAYSEVIDVTEDNPFREASQLSLAELLSKAKRHTQALKVLDVLRKETKKPAIAAEATARIGLLYLEEKKNAEAIKELEAALAMPEIGAWREIAQIGLLRVFYNDGKYDKVLEIYGQSEGKFSATALPEVLLVVANSQRQLNQHDEANKVYDRIIAEFGTTAYAAEASYERLVALYNTDSPDLIPAIDAYLAANPDAGPRQHDQLTLMKAEAFYKKKEYLQAAPVYAALEDSQLPSVLKAEAVFKLGWCYAQSGMTDQAITAFTTFLGKYPKNKLTPTALAQRGFSHQQKRQFREALADFDQLLKDYPKAKEREFALLHKALIAGQLEDNRGMADTFRTLLKEFPQSPAAGQANYWIGLSALQSRDYAAAIAPLTAARELDKEFGERASAHLLAAYFALENRDGLASAVDNADEKLPVRPEMLRWLGTEYLKAGDAANSVKYYQVLLKREDAKALQPADWLDLGKAQSLLEEWDAAITSLNAYLEKVSDPIPKARGYLALGQTQLGKGDLDGALSSARQVQALQPEGTLHAQGRILAGDVAMARNDYAEAAKLFMSVSLIFEDPLITPQAMEKAYLAYRRAGDTENAGKTLNRLQTRFPEYRITQPTAGLKP